MSIAPMPLASKPFRCRVVELAIELAGGSVAGRRVCVLGVASKRQSDDIRSSPALDVAVQLDGLGALVCVYDPAAMANAFAEHPALMYAGSAVAAARGAEVVLLLTYWAEVRDSDPEALGEAVAKRVVIDARPVLDPGRWKIAGWEYHVPGRPAA